MIVPHNNAGEVWRRYLVEIDKRLIESIVQLVEQRLKMVHNSHLHHKTLSKLAIALRIQHGVPTDQR